MRVGIIPLGLENTGRGELQDPYYLYLKTGMEWQLDNATIELVSKSELSRPRKLRLFQLEMTHFQPKESASHFIPISSLTLIQLPVKGYLSCFK